MLSDSEYRRIHMLEEDEYAKLSDEEKRRYERTHSYHFQKRMQGVEHGPDDLLINGMSPQEWKEHYRKMQTMRPDPRPPSNYANPQPIEVGAGEPPVKPTGVPRLPLPQARILQALLPVAGEPPSLSRAELAQRMNVSPTSGTISVALGGRSDSPHKGLLDAGLVTKVKGEGNEAAYQITTAGITAIKDYIKEHGKLPPPKDKTLSTNIRYQK
jgi:hypothetical protein